jgi:hypothetical protein
LTRSLATAAVGALIGWLAESVHRRAGVWSLPGGGPMPAWVALAYFVGLLGASEALCRFEQRHPGALALGPTRVGAEALGVVVLFLAPPLLHDSEQLLLGLAVAWLAARLVWLRAPGDLAVALGVAGADVVFESALTAARLFRYQHASLGPLPSWLFPLWGGLALGLRRLFAYLRQFATP